MVGALHISLQEGLMSLLYILTLSVSSQSPRGQLGVLALELEVHFRLTNYFTVALKV